MPIQLPALSRRDVLRAGVRAGVWTGVWAGASALVGCTARERGGSAPPAPTMQRILFLSDTHITADPADTNRDGSVNMDECLRRVMQDIASTQQPFDWAVLNGDASHRGGSLHAYERLLTHLQPLRDNGTPVAITLGNHDDRTLFFQATGQHETTLANKHITRRRDPLGIDWYLLDSLQTTNKTPGTLGPAQLAWLDQELATHATHPAILVLHHPPLPPEEGKEPWGLLDDAELFKVLSQHKNPRAMICGHAHRWERRDRDNVALVGLPPTCYVFRDNDPWGYVVAQHDAKRLLLTLHALGGSTASQQFTINL